MGYDYQNNDDAYDEEYDEEETSSSNRGLVAYRSSQQYPSSGGILGERLLLAIVCLTFAMILCTFAGWATWSTISHVIAATGTALSGFLGGLGRITPFIGLAIGLALTAAPLIIVAWLGGHLYITLKARSIRSRTFAVNPIVNNYAALYDERTGTFIQPEAGELPATVPSVPQTYSPHITYQYKGGATVYEEEEEGNQQGLLPPPGSVQRYMIEELARATTFNSMRVPIGRSLTTREPVELDVDGGNVLVIGTSQKGKSSWIASYIAVITLTHDRQHVLLSILDLENKTGKLFEDVEHIIRIEARRGKVLKLHARDVHQVAEFLGYLRDEMDRRYTLSEVEQSQQPFVLIYFEEFLSFRRSNKISSEIRDKAFNNFAELAKRGLKVRMKLLASAQVNYAAKEEDVREAMGNFDTYVAFSVKPDAARAAGMICTDLLNANFESKKEGQFVIESVESNDIVLSPEFPLKQKLLDYEKTKGAQQENMAKMASQPPRSPLLNAGNATTPSPIQDSLPPEQTPSSWMTEREANVSGTQPRTQLDASPEANLHSKVTEVLNAMADGLNTKDGIISRVWHATKGSSRDYKEACAEYEQVMRIISSLGRRGMEIYQSAEQEG